MFNETLNVSLRQACQSADASVWRLSMKEANNIDNKTARIGMRGIPVSEKYCGIKSDDIIDRGLAKYRCTVESINYSWSSSMTKKPQKWTGNQNDCSICVWVNATWEALAPINAYKLLNALKNFWLFCSRDTFSFTFTPATKDMPKYLTPLHMFGGTVYTASQILQNLMFRIKHVYSHFISS